MLSIYYFIIENIYEIDTDRRWCDNKMQYKEKSYYFSFHSTIILKTLCESQIKDRLCEIVIIELSAFTTRVHIR